MLCWLEQDAGVTPSTLSLLLHNKGVATTMKRVIDWIELTEQNYIDRTKKRMQEISMDTTAVAQAVSLTNEEVLSWLNLDPSLTFEQRVTLESKITPYFGIHSTQRSVVSKSPVLSKGHFKTTASASASSQPSSILSSVRINTAALTDCFSM